MNLRAIANGAITGVNPNIQATLKVNVGVTTDDTGRRASNFIEEAITIQTQSLSSQELLLFDTLAQQGQLLNVYITGQLHALRRITSNGADKLTFTAYGEKEPAEWLIKQVAESWADWCKVVVWRQS